MNLTLTWKNNNIVPITTQIYRGDAPLDPAALPEPLVTLTGGEETWVDTTAVRGRLYYYVFVNTGATDKLVSKSYPIKATPRRGHGPNELIYGDYELGYFGSMTSAEFVNTADLLIAMGYDSLYAQGKANLQGGLPTWYKFVRNGKFLYIPSGALSSSISVGDVISKGAWFGNDLLAPEHSGAGTIVQNARIKIGNDVYRIRLLRGTEKDPMLPIDEVLAGTPFIGRSEWDDCAATLLKFTSPAQKLPNIGGITATLWGFYSGSSGSPCQERTIDGRYLYRGRNVNTELSVTASGTVNTGNFAWLPILELIESTVEG